MMLQKLRALLSLVFQ